MKLLVKFLVNLINMCCCRLARVKSVGFNLTFNVYVIPRTYILRILQDEDEDEGVGAVNHTQTRECCYGVSVVLVQDQARE